MDQPWQKALLHGGAAMLGGDRNLSTGQLLALGIQGGMQGVQAAKAEGKERRNEMVKMQQLQSQLADAALQRRAQVTEMEEAALKRKQDRAKNISRQGHLEALAAGKSPEEQAALFLNPDAHINAQIAANAPISAIDRAKLEQAQAQLDQQQSQFQQGFGLDKEKLGLTREQMTNDRKLAILKAQSAADKEKTPEDYAAIERAKAEAKHTVDRQMNIGGEIEAAQKGLENARAMGELAKSVPAGVGSGLLTGADKVLENASFGTLGLGVDSAAADEFETRMARETLEAASQLSGTISDKDMEFLEKSAGGGAGTKEGRARVVKIIEDGYAKKLKSLESEHRALQGGSGAIGAKDAAIEESAAAPQPDPAPVGDYSSASDDEIKAELNKLFGGLSGGG